MVAIHPFCALRYNPDLVGELGGVLAPPYDVISPEEQEQLYQASPYNVVRLTLARSFPTDTGEENHYTRAQQAFDVWRGHRILELDPVPAIYLVKQTFDDSGTQRSRLGFIALLGLDASAERGVYRHEATMAAPKQDRARLLEALPANLEPIFCVFPDEGGTVQARLQDLVTRAAPTARATLKEGSIQLWAITDPRVIQDVAHPFISAAVLIADGHHRFEVAYAQRARYGALMAYFVSMADPSLVVRPIHRVVQPDGAAEGQGLRGVCRLERATDLVSLIRWLKDDRGPASATAGAAQASERAGCFGYYDGRALYQVTVDPDRLARWLMAPSVPLPLATLDVSLLHELILPAVIPDGRTVRCTYTVDASEALRAVDRRAGQSAWLLRTIPLPQIFALAARGLALPPKSTYFYPKVPSGLTINPFTSV